MSSPNECKRASDVSVRIERLILDGFNLTPQEQTVFRAALEAELTKRFTRGGFEPALTGAMSSLPAQSIHLSQTHSPALLGERVGAAVFGTLRK